MHFNISWRNTKETIYGRRLHVTFMFIYFHNDIKFNQLQEVETFL